MTEATAIKASDVKALRERTGAAMMDCKAALTEAGGDAEKAVEILRVKGQASAAKRSGRSTGEGVVSSYIHANHRIGVLVEVQCETDFVARNDDFAEFAREIALHVAAAAPRHAYAVAQGDTRWVFLDGEVYEFEVQRPGRRRTSAHHASLSSPMRRQQNAPSRTTARYGGATSSARSSTWSTVSTGRSGLHSCAAPRSVHGEPAISSSSTALASRVRSSR